MIEIYFIRNIFTFVENIFGIHSDMYFKKTLTMKKALLLTALLFSIIFQGQAQRFDYEKNSKLFFGLNVGRTWHTSDVENVTKRFPIGVGAIFGGSVNQNYGNLFSYDIRVRYLGGNWFGQDSDTTHAIQQNTAVNSIYDTLGYAVQNFKATQHRLSIELSMHANRLKERSGIDPYVFAGIGFTNTRTKGDLVDGNGNHYPYNQNPSGGIIDKDHNTPLDLNEDGEPYKKDEFDVKVLPSLGVGIGYYFNSRFSLGIEHKTTFFMDDYFDGTTLDQNGQPSKIFENDLYHYTSIYFKWYLKKTERSPKPERETNTPPVAPRPERPGREREPERGREPGRDRNNRPLVHFTTPAVSPHRTNDNQFNLVANVINVADAQNITFLKNGKNSRQFSFNPTTNTFEAQVRLNPGENVFYLEGRNNFGKDHDQTTLIFEREVQEHKPKMPIVKITDPGSYPHYLNKLNYTVIADIKNVKARNQLTVTFNGNSVSNFNYQSTGNNNFSIPLQLKAGKNTLKIQGRNNFGKDSDQTVLIYNRGGKPEDPPCLDPEITLINPTRKSTRVINNTFDFRAVLQNINNVSEIQLTQNGRLLKDFQYHPHTRNLSSQFKLNEGKNNFVLTLNNGCSSVSEKFSIIYDAPPKCSVLFATAEFCLNTPSGTIKGKDLNKNNGFTYDGPAKSLYFKATSNGKATVNGKDFNIVKGNYYHFMGSISVEIGKNRKGSNNQWSLCVGSMRRPLFGKGRDKPASPCAPTIDTRPDKRPNIKPNKKERPDVREKPGKRERPDVKERSRRGSGKPATRPNKGNKNNPRGRR